MEEIDPARSGQETGGLELNRSLLGIAGVASGAAGLVHASAAGTHQGDRALVLLFALTASVQLGWAALAAMRPSRQTALVGTGVSSLFVLAWLASRTVGLPVTDALREVESVGTQDLVAALLATMAAVTAVLAIAPPLRRLRLGEVWIGGLALAVLALAVPGMAAEHPRDASHEHADGDAVAGDDHSSPAAGHEAPGSGDQHGDGGSSHDPITSLDDERLSDAQRDAAQSLITETAEGMTELTDVASVEAAGYESIGDARTGYEHFINWSYLEDGAELDATKIESIVFEVDGAERTAVSAMYILDKGKTMDDVPEVAGELTTWHDHTNLCWDESGTRLAGIVVRDRCVPRGTLWETPPMLHVWLEEQPCGWFAGIEGVGGLAGHGSSDCDHDHSAAPDRLDHDPTDAQKDRARALIEQTKAGLARFADPADAIAAGYRSIGDGRRPGGYEHYINRTFLANDTILDASEPESLVYRHDADGSKELTTAMYILPPGSTMDDVPDIAGNLTTWHGHDNLCFDSSTGQLAGIFTGGTCVPGGTRGSSTPMLHVWIVPNDCGPFAGTDARSMTGSCVEDF